MCWQIQVFSNIHCKDDCALSLWYKLCTLCSCYVPFRCQFHLVYPSQHIFISSIGNSLHDTLVVGVEKCSEIPLLSSPKIIPSIGLSHLLLVQMNNCGKDNKSKYIMLFWSALTVKGNLSCSPHAILYCWIYAWGCKYNVREVWTKIEDWGLPYTSKPHDIVHECWGYHYCPLLDPQSCWIQRNGWNDTTMNLVKTNLLGIPRCTKSIFM